MKQTILMSGLVVLLTASWKTKEEPVLVTTTTIGTHTEGNGSRLITSKTIEMNDSAALEVVNRLFARFKAGASPTELASFYDEKADWFIPGDTRTIPWIGKRTGRKEIAEHYRLLKQYIKPEKLDVAEILTKGNRVVILGYLESRYKENNKLIKSEFSIDIIVENGLITRYHFLEDSFDVSVKAKS